MPKIVPRQSLRSGPIILIISLSKSKSPNQVHFKARGLHQYRLHPILTTLHNGVDAEHATRQMNR